MNTRCNNTPGKMAKVSVRMARGFTLPEMLVVLVILALLSTLTLNVSGPWLAFRAQLENQQQLQNIKSALVGYFESNPYAVESQATNLFGPLTRSVVSSNTCNSQAPAFGALAARLDAGSGQAGLDSYKNNLCVFIGASSKSVSGSTLYYRAVAVVSTGSNGLLDTGTSFNAAALTLTLAGDDEGFVINTLSSNMEKLARTQERLDRVGRMYELFFTSRYLASTGRDMTQYYFSRAGDLTTSPDVNPVSSTGGNWANASTHLLPLGVSNELSTTGWTDSPHSIQVGNHNESVTINGNTTTVRSLTTVARGALPYTALLRARLPSPPGVGASYASKVVVGSY